MLSLDLEFASPLVCTILFVTRIYTGVINVAFIAV